MIVRLGEDVRAPKIILTLVQITDNRVVAGELVNLRARSLPGINIKF